MVEIISSYNVGVLYGFINLTLGLDEMTDSVKTYYPFNVLINLNLHLFALVLHSFGESLHA